MPSDSYQFCAYVTSEMCVEHDWFIDGYSYGYTDRLENSVN